MAKQHNWVGESVTGTPGTGTITLGGALLGAIRFEDAFVTLDAVHYSIEDGYDKEIGIGTLTTGTPWTLARTTVLETLVSGTYDDTSPAAITLSSSAIVSIDFMADMPGTIVGSAITTDSVYQSTALTIPQDNTEPLYSEGFELMTVAYTPKYANSKLVVTASVYVRCAGTAVATSVALFKDGSGSDLAIATGYLGGGDVDISAVHVLHEETLSATTAITFNIRVGSNSGTTYINGDASAGKHNALLSTYVKVEEIRQ